MNSETPAPATTATPAAKPAPSKPPFQAPPAGIPPLVPTPGLEKALGGRVIPMRVGRGTPAPAKPAPLPGEVAANLSGTFSGAAAGDPDLKAKIATARVQLGKAIILITDLEASLPALLEDIDKQAPAALASENFDPAEAKEFYQALITALDTIRK